MTNWTAGPHAGRNAPSGVSRVLITGFYDGATDGLMQFGDGGPVYAFAVVEEESHERERVYDLRPMPADAIDRFAAAVAEHMSPVWPVWCPAWEFPTDEARRAADEPTDAIMADAGLITWRITTEDLIAFASFEAEPVGSAVRGG